MRNPGMQMTLLMLALLPIAGAAVLGIVPNERRTAAAILAGAVPLLGLVVVLLLAPRVFAGEVVRWSVDWVPTLRLSFGFRMDGLAWLFALLICAIGALVVLYAAYYLHLDDPAARFYRFLLLFMGSMLGLVLADNLLLLVVFWEATSLSSFLLIGYWSQRPDAREGARMALTITGAGGLALLGGVLLLGHIVGSFQLDAVLAASDVIHRHPLYVPALLLVLLGAFTKSAQFPFHFWLPHAMAAPTPVSAYLHSATMVKAGVFLLARLYPALGHSDEWFWIVSLTGLSTLLLGAYLAIFQHDLKGLLAYSTISHLGLITLLFGLDNALAVVAGVFHIINHATFKASLFMAAGIIDHETGTRDMRRLNGLWKYMPWTGALAIVASAAMAGVPLVNGFLSKEMFFGAALSAEGSRLFAIVLPVGATIAGIFGVAYSVRFIHDVFFNGEPAGLTRVPHEPPRFMRIPVEVLVFCCLAVGVVPVITVGPMLAAGAAAALGAPLPGYSLALWHGFNLPLLMSSIAFAGGLTLYFGLQKFINLHHVTALSRGGREAFGFLFDRAIRLARAVTLALQNGSLQRYLLMLVVVAILAGFLPFLRGARVGAVGAMTPAGPIVIAIVLMGTLFAIAAAVVYRRRLVSLLFLGAVGLVVAWIFVYLSAPDLALTQVLVELVTVILMMLALHWLPQNSPREAARGGKALHLAVAGLAGVGIAAMAFLVMTRPFDSISSYFLENAVSLGGGANVVNVILVDFRGFDTLGEITVLGVAAIIVSSLLAPGARVVAQSPAGQPMMPPGQISMILALSSRLLMPFVLLVAVFLFLRGHNEPGGGFIGGLVLGIGLILQYIANGQHWTEERLPRDFAPWVAWGLLIAGLTGVASGLFGSPFLTSTYDYPRLPLIGAVPLASASVFDLGVFLAVVGATMTMLAVLGRLQERR
jgi:multicomponent K+:H+ antiporter subunit A